MGIKIEESVEETIEQTVASLGYMIEYVEFVKEGENHILRIVLDKPEGIVDIEGCELVSRTVEDMVDTLITKEYVLEVSSPGVERQLKNIKLYRKYISYPVYLKLYQKIEEGKEITGILQAVTENNSIVLTLDSGKEIEIPIENITTAHTIYDFGEALKAKKQVNLNQLNKFNKK